MPALTYFAKPLTKPYTSNFATGGSPTTTIVSNPVSSIGGTVLRYANGTNTASWIKNSVPLVAANSSGTHEVGVDLYIPSTSITSTEVITIQINGNVNHRIELASANNLTTNGAFRSTFPYDSWFRVVFKFNFDTKTYDLLLMQNSAIYKTQFTNRSMTIASVDLTASGITDMRVHMQGSNQTIYMDNFGILTEEVSFGMYDFYDSTWTAFF